jgi:hypothetical protein
MLAGDLNRCTTFPCTDVRHVGHTEPDLPVHRDSIRVIMISAAPPTDAATIKPGYREPIDRTETIQAFRSAGFDVGTIEDIRRLGVYVTTAVKCPKVGFGLKQETVEACSHLLEAEIDQFPNLKSILLMGNTAIRAINAVAERKLGAPVIPNGSAYKVKGHEYPFGDVSLFPSYPESGRNLSVEGNRQDVIAVDIRNAIEVAGGPATRPHRSRPSPERRHSPVPPPYVSPGGFGE